MADCPLESAESCSVIAEKIKQKEDECLQWLLAHSDEIVDSNNEIQQAMLTLRRLTDDINAFSTEMETFLGATMQLNRAGVTASEEYLRNCAVAEQLEAYIASIVVSPETDRSIRGGDVQGDGFWKSIADLAEKNRNIQKFKEEADSWKWESLKKAECALMNLESIAATRLHTFIEKHLQGVGPKGLEELKRNLASQTTKAYDFLFKHRKSEIVTCILSRYVDLVRTAHMRQAEAFFNVIGTVPTLKITEPEFLNMMSLWGFPCGPPSREKNDASISSWIRDIVSTKSASAVVSTPIEMYIPDVRELHSRFSLLTEYSKPTRKFRDERARSLSLSSSSVLMPTVEVPPFEEIFRTAVLTLIEASMKELKFMKSYFLNEFLNGSQGTHNTSPAIGTTSLPVDGEGALPRQKLYHRFEDICASTMNLTRSTLGEKYIKQQWDLLPLLITWRLCDCFFAYMKSEQETFADNMINNLQTTTVQQTKAVVTAIVRAIKKDFAVEANPYLDRFNRKGLWQGLSSSSFNLITRVLLSLLMTCGDWGVPIKYLTDIRLLIEMASTCLSELVIDSNPNSYNNLYTFIQELDVLMSFDYRESATHAKSLHEWAQTEVCRITEQLSSESIDAVRPDLLETIKQVETCINNGQPVEETVKQKLSSFAQIDCSEDVDVLMRNIENDWLQEKNEASEMNIRKDILAKYAVVHCRLQKALKACEIPDVKVIGEKALWDKIQAYLG